MDFYGWLNSLSDLLVREIETELKKGFTRDGRMSWEASKHSEAMMLARNRYHAPKEFMGAAARELIGQGFADYNQFSIEQTVKQVAHEFLRSNDGHCAALCESSVIGVGISVLMISSTPHSREIHRVGIFATVRLR